MKAVKGIILAGGSGTRLYPITKSVSKQLLPVYNKPMILLSIGLMLSIGIKEILIIVRPNDKMLFERLLGDGSDFKCKIIFKTQRSPKGIAEAIKIGRMFINSKKIMLLLGDNFFYGHGLKNLINTALESDSGASIFSYQVQNPNLYGVLNKKNNQYINIVEKPKKPSTNLAIPGMYIYDQKVKKYVDQILPSKRGELEITDINNLYFKYKDIEVINLAEGITWMDMGDFDSYLDACMFVAATEKRQGFPIFNYFKKLSKK